MALDLRDPQLDAQADEVSRLTGESLLFKGDDFGHTDIGSALAP